MSIRLKRCEGSDECASRDEIDEFADGLLFAYAINTQVYNPNEYGETTVEDSLIAGGTAIRTDISFIDSFNIQVNELESDDSLYSLGFQS